MKSLFETFWKYNVHFFIWLKKNATKPKSFNFCCHSFVHLIERFFFSEKLEKMWLVKFPLSSFKDSSEILPAMYDKNKFRNGKEKYRSKQITQLHIGLLYL